MRIPETSVAFHTADAGMQRVYDDAVRKCRLNLTDFCGRRVLVEGGGYEKIWLETQPMGGEMYAKRDVQAALNNQLLFMETQRADGRMPGSITVENGKIVPQFNKFQGFCFPEPALNLYYWIGKDREYLSLLYDSLIKLDAYLWRVRDSNSDGCLESWCVTDTGEDGALRYGDAPFWWTEDAPPTDAQVVPIQSMDFMSFSFAARDALAKISPILGDEKAAYWRAKADDVRAKMRAYLWDDARGACFDRDRHGRVMDTLLHNNLRVMYWGAFDQAMADRFVREHLLNPADFWTPFPLPSVAASDPLFRNNPGNDWSGQPQGLTYQRAIRALERYGYQGLHIPLANKLIGAVGAAGVFPQQFDAFTGKPGSGKDGYGPTMLAVLEYIERLHGVHLEGDERWWGAAGGTETEYTQAIDDVTYTLRCDGKTAHAQVNGREVAVFDAGQRLVTDAAGNPMKRIPLKGTVENAAR